MDLKAFRYLIWAALLLFFQVTTLNHVHIFGYITPVVYPMLLLILPFRMSTWVLLVLAMLYGLILDMFANTPGMHAASLLVIAWLRPHVISLTLPRGGIESDDEPRIGSLGLQWFATYALLLLTVHQVVLTFIEVFSLNEFFNTALKALLSALASVLLVIVLEYIFTPRKSRR